MGSGANAVASFDNLEQILEEKSQLERALASVTEMYKSSVSEKDQLSKLFADFKHHHETLKTEKNTYQQRLVDEITARKRSENECEERIKSMQQRLDGKDRELDVLT